MVAAGVAATAALVAQPARPGLKAGYEAKDNYGTMHIKTGIGTFKIIDGEGRVQMKFHGTLLLTKHKEGKLTVLSGKLRKEHEKDGRAVYTGDATVLVDGKWRGLQFFGSGLEFEWYGMGAIRFSAEFDSNLKTGEYWYEDPNDRQPMPATSMLTMSNPQPIFGANPRAAATGRRGKIGG